MSTKLFESMVIFSGMNPNAVPSRDPKGSAGQDQPLTDETVLVVLIHEDRGCAGEMLQTLPHNRSCINS